MLERMVQRCHDNQMMSLGQWLEVIDPWPSDRGYAPTNWRPFQTPAIQSGYTQQSVIHLQHRQRRLLRELKGCGQDRIVL
jgi:hypothetical protein